MTRIGKTRASAAKARASSTTERRASPGMIFKLDPDCVARLMDRKPEARFQFIQENAAFVKDGLDS